jgi:O-antigen ligase
MPVLFILFSTSPDSFDNLIKKTKDQLIQEKGIQIFPNHYLGHFYTTFKIIKLNPLTGAGTDSFDYNCYNDKYVSFYDSYYDMNNKKVWLNSCSTHPHNFYLQIFSENGILAFLMFVFFYISLIRELILSRKKSYGNTQIFYELCLVSAICCYFPFAPSLSFYNTYLNSISYFPIIFIIFHNLRYKHKIL